MHGTAFARLLGAVSVAAMLAPAGAIPLRAEIPQDLIGTWDISAERCGQSFAYSTTKIGIAPDLLDFHYGRAEIVETERIGEALFLRGRLSAEGTPRPGPETAHYRIDHAPGSDRLTWKWGALAPVAMIRCDGGAQAARPRSRYTSLDLTDCDPLDTARGGPEITVACPGDRGVLLFVTIGDRRHAFHVGAPGDGLVGGLPFNTPGRTVEWRYDGFGALAAVILRYRYDTGPDRGRPSDLAVIRPAGDDLASCIVGLVPADAAPGQNAAARAVADDMGGRACLDGG